MFSKGVTTTIAIVVLTVAQLIAQPKANAISAFYNCHQALDELSKIEETEDQSSSQGKTVSLTQLLAERVIFEAPILFTKVHLAAALDAAFSEILIYSEGDGGNVPGNVRKAASEKVWQFILNYYKYPSLEDDKGKNNLALTAYGNKLTELGVDEGSFKKIEILLQKINSSSLLKAQMLHLIDASMSDIFKIASSFKDDQGNLIASSSDRKIYELAMPRIRDFNTRKAFFDGLPKRQRDIPFLQMDVTALTEKNISVKKTFNGGASRVEKTDFLSFVSIQHPILFGSAQRVALKEALRKAGLDENSFYKSLKKYSENDLSLLAQSTWNNLLFGFDVKPGEFKTYVDSDYTSEVTEMQNLASKYSMTLHTFLQSRIAIKAINENASARAAAMALIKATIKENTYLAIQMSRTQADRKASWIEKSDNTLTTTFFTGLAGSVGAAGLGMLNGSDVTHFYHAVPIFIGSVAAMPGVFLADSVGVKIYGKYLDFNIRRTYKKMIEKAKKTPLPSTDGSEEE